MKRALLCLALIAVAFPLHAIDRNECAGQLTHLGTLYQLRSLMMHGYTSSSDVERFIDRRVEELREPQAGGGYKWVRWVRPTGNGPTDKKVHTVAAVQGVGDPDSFTASDDHVYEVRLVVPSKRSLFKGNRAVYVGDVQITYDDPSAGHRRKADVFHLNRWMNPDTSQAFDLGGIADHVMAVVNASTGEKDAHDSVIEFHFRNAVLQDDPANPSYSTIKALQRIRETPDPATVDAEIAALEASLFPGSDSLPLLTIMHDLRQADELMRSQKADEQEKGDKLLKDTLRRLR